MGQPQDNGQGHTGKENPAEDDDRGGEDDPFPKKSGQAEEDD